MERVGSSLGKVLLEFEKHYGLRPDVVASAPGRLDFLNTHQDYKGLPVVSIAINRRTYIAFSKRTEKVRVISLNLCDEGVECVDEFSVNRPSLRGGRFFGDYVRSVITALKERGYSVQGFNALISSEVPIASGLASSAALQVALVTGLNELFDLGLNKNEIAELAYHSEHDIMGIPCGRLDQYGSAMGGITVINTRPPYSTRTYRGFNWVFVVLDSGIRHSTAEVHPKRISEVERGLSKLLENPGLPKHIREKLSTRIDGVLWEDIRLEELEYYLEQLDETSRKRIAFTLKMNDSTMLALRLLENPDSSVVQKELAEFIERECPECAEPAKRAGDVVLELVAGVVNYQHVLLRDLYDVSLPELELIREKALSAGALGVKISGAGLGGSLLALVKNLEEARNVVREVSSIARHAWIVEVDEGARVEYRSLGL